MVNNWYKLSEEMAEVDIITTFIRFLGRSLDRRVDGHELNVGKWY